MLRQLLTLLAVITGMTLTVAPAESARASEISVTAAAHSHDCERIVSVPMHIGVPHKRQPAQRQKCPKAVVTVWVPTIMLGIDRARE